ncbi:MAG: hypothetical protein COV75_02275 [Candidatus Omnitrophica bacterium CG11_big_fil_rev_8_21_14_0_20_63_9]|nr:MAG: hypothetical protein COV75_02275 [Candidatus Omnitrophica bacterium CG11_big_fil_rev_8_21_14_0_20_63_9]
MPQGVVEHECDAPSSAAGWDEYWLRAKRAQHQGLYARIAEFYRSQIISRAAARILARYLRNETGRHYLHAGCGSGGSDRRLACDRPTFHALDFSFTALTMNRARSLPGTHRFVCADLFHLPYRAQSIDGIFNFGVMEHLTEQDIERALAQFHRVMTPDGYVVLFWPPNFGLSVMVLTSWLWIVNRFRKRPMKLYPDEISRVRSFRWVRELMARAQFQVVRTEFGWRDLFTFVVVIARPLRERASAS